LCNVGAAAANGDATGHLGTASGIDRNIESQGLLIDAVAGHSAGAAAFLASRCEAQAARLVLRVRGGYSEPVGSCTPQALAA